MRQLLLTVKHAHHRSRDRHQKEESCHFKQPTQVAPRLACVGAKHGFVQHHSFKGSNGQLDVCKGEGVMEGIIMM